MSPLLKDVVGEVAGGGASPSRVSNLSQTGRGGTRDRPTQSVALQRGVLWRSFQQHSLDAVGAQQTPRRPDVTESAPAEPQRPRFQSLTSRVKISHQPPKTSKTSSHGRQCAPIETGSFCASHLTLPPHSAYNISGFNMPLHNPPQARSPHSRQLLTNRSAVRRPYPVRRVPAYLLLGTAIRLPNPRLYKIEFP